MVINLNEIAKLVFKKRVGSLIFFNSPGKKQNGPNFRFSSFYEKTFTYTCSFYRQMMEEMEMVVGARLRVILVLFIFGVLIC